MKFFEVLLLCASLSLVSSCNNDEANEMTSSEFKIVASISPISRTPSLNEHGGGYFINGDQNTLFFHNEEQQVLQTFDYTHGTQYFWNHIQLPENTATCFLSGCYPKVSTNTPEHFLWDVTTEVNPDLLVAAPVSVDTKSPAPIYLSFAHLMHKLKIEIESADPNITDKMLQESKITLRQFKSVAEVNLLNGTLISAKGQLTNKQADGRQAEFIIPAQEAGRMEVEVVLNHKVGVFKLAEVPTENGNLQKLESGKSFTLLIKVNKEDFIINGQIINGWGNSGDFDDTIIM